MEAYHRHVGNQSSLPLLQFGVHGFPVVRHGEDGVRARERFFQRLFGIEITLIKIRDVSLGLELDSALSIAFPLFQTHLDAFHALLGECLGIWFGRIPGNSSDLELLGGARVAQN